MTIRKKIDLTDEMVDFRDGETLELHVNDDTTLVIEWNQFHALLDHWWENINAAANREDD